MVARVVGFHSYLRCRSCYDCSVKLERPGLRGYQFSNVLERGIRTHVPIFVADRLDYAIIVVLSGLLKGIGLGNESEQTQHERAEKTLLAVKELKRYLESVEKDLSRMSKKFSNKEIAHGVGFAATGIHEALTYLGIVKKVVEKTERIVAKSNIVSGIETAGHDEIHSDGRTNLSRSA